MARTIAHRLKGDATVRPFRYSHAGSLAQIGKRKAIIDFGVIKLRGALAWWIWGIAHIYFLIGLRKPAGHRVELAMDLHAQPAQRAADHPGPAPAAWRRVSPATAAPARRSDRLVIEVLGAVHGHRHLAQPGR